MSPIANPTPAASSYVVKGSCWLPGVHRGNQRIDRVVSAASPEAAAEQVLQGFHKAIYVRDEGGGSFTGMVGNRACGSVTVEPQRQRNPRAVPKKIVQLGAVLDLTFEPDVTKRIRIDEWRGWLMACGEHAMDAAPGHARLYLLDVGKPQDASEHADYLAAAHTYERWHNREANRVDVYDVPDSFEYFQGRVLRIGYRSDKWGQRGKAHDYDHDFTESGGRPPKLYTDTADLERAHAAVLVGGDMVISERGIA